MGGGVSQAVIPMTKPGQLEYHILRSTTGPKDKATMEGAELRDVQRQGLDDVVESSGYNLKLNSEVN